MKHARRRTLVVAGVLALVASLALAVAEQSLFHTDDGCAVEIHCVACRLVLGSVVVPQAALTFEPRLAPVAAVIAADGHVLPLPHRRASVSRGPPRPSSSAS
jgi:hypothetical protein